jgi:hypothetical protein
MNGRAERAELFYWRKSPQAISAELGTALLWAVGKKRGFCQLGIGGGDFRGHYCMDRRQKARPSSMTRGPAALA